MQLHFDSILEFLQFFLDGIILNTVFSISPLKPFEIYNNE